MNADPRLKNLGNVFCDCVVEVTRSLCEPSLAAASTGEELHDLVRLWLMDSCCIKGDITLATRWLSYAIPQLSMWRHEQGVYISL